MTQIKVGQRVRVAYEGVVVEALDSDGELYIEGGRVGERIKTPLYVSAEHVEPIIETPKPGQIWSLWEAEGSAVVFVSKGPEFGSSGPVLRVTFEDGSHLDELADHFLTRWSEARPVYTPEENK